MSDDGTTALNDRVVSEARQPAEHGRRQNLISPARRDDICETGAQTRVRQLHRRCRRGSEQCVRTENDDRYGLGNALLGCRRIRHGESHERGYEYGEFRFQRTLLFVFLTKPIN